MGAVDETRKLVQDFLAPELREIKVRIEALEETTKSRFEAVSARINALEQTTKAHFDAAEQTTKARFDSAEQTTRSQHSEVMAALNHLTQYAALSERLTRLEAQKEQKAS